MNQPSHPEQIGRYRVLRPLGSGAMGDVFLALDPHIDRQLAVKTVRVLGGTPADIAERKQRLLREAKAAGKMMHPHVVTLFDADETDGLLYLAFEYVPGMDLAQRMAVQPTLTLGQALTIVRQVASALDYAHGQRIVHRDIKPSNILIGAGGEAKVADFGIAKVLGLTEMTRTGSVVGSPQYMSPEQVRGEPLDGRSDVFSLGVVLYELLCRSRPFGGDTLSTLIFEILSKEPPSVDRLRPGLPAALTGLVSRMMAKDREHRSASARAVMNELDGLWSSLDPALLQTPLESRLGTPQRAGSSAVSAIAPTATMDDAPTLDSGSAPQLPPLPPVPGVPTATAPSAVGPSSPFGPPPTAVPQAPVSPSPIVPAPAGPPPPTPVASPAPAPHPSVARPSPLDSGTYAGAGRGKMVGVVALGLVAALAIGFFAAQWLGGGSNDSLPNPDTGESATAAGQVAENKELATAGGKPADAVESAPQLQASEASAGAGSQDAEGKVGLGSVDPGSQVSGGDAAESESTGVPSASPSPEAQDPGATQTREPALTREPAAIQSPRNDPVTTEQPPPTRTTATDPVAGAPRPQQTAPAPREPAVVTPPPVSETVTESVSANPREVEFDRRAAQASRELSTGLRFYFDIKPKDTIIKIQARGERSIVQGRAEDFKPGKDGRPMELPDSGDYLITLVHPSHPDLVTLVHASAQRGNPHTVRLNMANAARSTDRRAVGPQVIRVSRGMSFSGRPEHAEVWLDGEKVGRASDWPGGRLPRSRQNLQLERGSHTLRLQAEGYEPLEITVEVGTAGKRIHRFEYQLRRKP